MANMQQGRGGMGTHKHGISGHATKNAAYKAQSLREDHQERAFKERRKLLRPPMVNASLHNLLKEKV